MDEAMLGHLLHMIVAIWVLLLTISCDKVTRQLPGVVKRDLVWNTDVRNMANDMADWVADAFVYAINEGVWVRVVTGSASTGSERTKKGTAALRFVGGSPRIDETFSG